MKHIVVTLTVLALCFPLFAAEEKTDVDLSFGGPYLGNYLPDVEEADDWSVGMFTFGLWQRDFDTISSKFLEFREIPNGGVAPMFEVQGKKGDYRYHLIGEDVTQRDQQYFGRFDGSIWSFELDYTGIPHRFGNGGTSILIPVAELDKTEWRISDTLQESFQQQVETVPSRDYETLLGIVQPTLDTQPSNIDIELQRNRLNLAFSVLPVGGNFNIDVTYFNERRTGTRTNNGTAFGFFNVVETTDPIRYISQDFGVRASGTTNFGLFFAGVNFNDFENKFETFGWDNPWRASDSTDPIAYLGPANSTNGPKTGLMATFPSNQAWSVNGGTALKLGSRARLSADLQVGRWEQNEQQFIAHTVNTAITTLPSGRDATDPSILPAPNLDGQIDVFALNGYFTTRVTNDLRINARYRLYENENKTPRLRFEEGYVRFDAVWEQIPRISVPYGFNSDYFDLYGTYDVGRVVGFELGYKYRKIERTFRETEHTSEGTARAAVDFRFRGALVRGLYETGTRDFDSYVAVEGEEASFLDPEGPANQTVLRRFDQAKRDRTRVGWQAQYSDPSGIFSVSAAYFLNRDDYDDTPVPCQAASAEDLDFCPGGTQSPLGLQEAEFKTFSLDFDVSPADPYTFYALYSREDMFDFQTGRQSGGTLSFDPASNWSSRVDNKVDTFGAGVNVGILPDVLIFDLFYRYQKVDGNNMFTAGPALGAAEDIPRYDDTEINFFSAQIRHNFASNWSWAIGGFVERYTLDDTLTGSRLNYLPGSFFINANNGDYDAWTGWLNLSYRFTM